MQLRFRSAEVRLHERRVFKPGEEPDLNYDNSQFRITFATYPKAQAPVRFPLEWLGKPHGGLEIITEQQNNNVCGREGGREGGQQKGRMQGRRRGEEGEDGV